MKTIPALLIVAALAAPVTAQETKWVADTLTIQAEATHEADPDLATLTFHVRVQEKELRRAHELASAAVERIAALAARHAVAPADFSVGRFAVIPQINYNDRRQRARSYRVETTLTLRLRDFQKVGSLVDEAVDENITELRSLTYSLEDEEAAKRAAVAEAMKRAEARARAALGANGRQLGALRFAGVDISEPAVILRTVERHSVDSVELNMSRARSQNGGFFPQLPSQASPEKLRVTAKASCVFQLQ